MKEYCMCCGRELNEAKSVWLEFDQRNSTYHNFGDIPEQHNQGGFAFGPGCAKRKISEAKKARNVALSHS